MFAYKQLEKKFKRLSSLAHIQSITFWDEACMMPEGGGPARAEAMAELSVLIHEMITSTEMKDLLDEALEQTEALDPWQKSNLHEMHRSYKSSNCYEASMVEEMSIICAQSEQAWRKLRSANNWSEFLPFFKKVVDIKRKAARIVGEQKGKAPYDALLDDFEPGQSSEGIDRLFQPLRDELPELTQKILEKQKLHTVKSPKGPFDIDKQKQLGVEIMQAIGFDFHHGRLDVSHHPFCGGVPEDVRITTRYSADEFIQSLMGIIHETGHALYEQNLPKEWLNQPVGKARSMGVHEGQSLLFEMQVAHSASFIEYLAPLVRKYFATTDKTYDWSDENILRLINRVEKGLIRVASDEVTYPAHIILRFEIEKALIEGDMNAEDLPAVWNEKMQKYLGISTEGNYKNGCMQDVHWPSGSFGYFPSYTLGAMNAAQAFSAATKHNPCILSEIKEGNFKPLNDWFSEKIWSKGCLYDTDNLMKSATGETLNPRYFLDHLKSRYLEDSSN